MMKIYVAGSNTIRDSLIDIVGGEITSPFHHFGVNVGNTEAAIGGFAYHRTDKKDIDAARDDLKYQDFSMLASTIADESHKRLRYVFGPVEASCAFRLPVPADGREIMGITVKQHLSVLTGALPETGILIGSNRYGLETSDVMLEEEERRKHCYIQGATGTGKTTLILNTALQDINSGKGVIVIDFHGDLCADLLKRIPDDRADDVVYFNPSDMEYPVGFNPLSYDPKSPLKDLQKERIVSLMKSWCEREFTKESMGPVFFQNIRNGLLLAMADDENPGTLINFVNIFLELDAALIAKKLEKLHNPLVKRFWKEVFNARNYKTTSDGLTMQQYILSKFAQFSDSEMTRNIFAQKNAKMDFRYIIDNGKVLICNFSKGLIGEFNAKFFGLMTLFKIEQAALSRADIPEEQRKDCFVYLDECQNIQTEYFSNLLAEMRKYRLNITLANQHFSQLDDTMRDSIIGNCGTFVIFKTGIADATLMEQMLYPYSTRLLTRLSNYQAVVRMPVKGNVQIFTVETLPLRFEDKGTMEAMVDKSRQSYAVRRGEVEGLFPDS